MKNAHCCIYWTEERQDETQERRAQNVSQIRRCMESIFCSLQNATTRESDFAWIERSAIMHLHGPYLCHNNMTTLPCSNMNLKNPLCGTTRQIISFSRAYRLHFELEQAISRSIIPTIIYSIPFLIQQFCFRLCDEHFLLTGMSAWLQICFLFWPFFYPS